LRVGAFSRAALGSVRSVDFPLLARQASALAGLGIARASALRDTKPGAAVAVVGDHLNVGGLQGVDESVVAGGTQVVTSTGQRRRGPDQSTGRVGEDLHVHAVALVLSGVCAVRRLLFEWR
jgi:hypothetical protein